MPSAPHIPTRWLAALPVCAALVALAASEPPPSPLRGVLIVACVTVASGALASLVERAEDAAAACRQMVQPGVDDPDAVMRASARWGADVLSRVANGESAGQAVGGAMPRVRAGAAPSEAGSDDSLASVVGGTDLVARACLRDAAASPSVEVLEQIQREQRACRQNAARMAPVPERDVEFQYAIPPVLRPNASPPRAQLRVGFVNGIE